ncbi:hypothetical protein BDFB_006925, partial [Asbolus verrucosus]
MQHHDDIDEETENLQKHTLIPKVVLILRIVEIVGEEGSEKMVNIPERRGSGRCAFCDGKKNRKTRYRCHRICSLMKKINSNCNNCGTYAVLIRKKFLTMMKVLMRKIMLKKETMEANLN